MGSEHLFRRGKIWFAWAYDSTGQQVRFSCRTPSKERARAILLQREAEFSGRHHRGPAPSHTVEDALNFLVERGTGDLAPETVAFYRKKAGTLNRMMGKVELADLTQERVLRYISERLEEKVKPATVSKELVTLRRALKLAKPRKELQLDLDVSELVPKFDPRYRPRERRLSHDEARRLLDALRPRRRLWVLIAVLGGGRLSEINRLSWNQLDLEGGWLHWGTKTEKSRRSVPLHPSLKRALMATSQRHGLVCEWRNPAAGLAYACARLGLTRASPNDLRRTFISWLKEAGVDTFVVAKLAGHASSRMIDQVYGHLTDAPYRAAVGALPRLGYRRDKLAGFRATSGTHGKSREAKTA
jgi:integrase